MKITGITLIFSTFNGEDTLSLTLESINNLLPPSCFINLIIIDNNSTDNTRKILNAFECIFPLKIIEEKRQGKNAALNSALRKIKSINDLVIFTDDDVLFDKYFLLEYEILANNKVSYDVFGGAIEPHWEERPPENMLTGINGVVAFAITPGSAGYKNGEIDPVKLHGPNMAIRKEIFDDGILFNENIGPSKGLYIMGSETELLYRLKMSGYKAFFSNDIKVLHIIKSEQYSEKWIANRAYKAGRALAIQKINNNESIFVKEFMGYPRWALLCALRNLFAKFISGYGSVKYYNNLWEFHNLRGYCDEYKLHSSTKN